MISKKNLLIFYLRKIQEPVSLIYIECGGFFVRERRENMFQVGDLIIYGNNGVCRVENIGSMEMQGIPSDRVYYTLVPVYEKKSKLFTPVDNAKVVMRPVLTEQEANDLIDHLTEVQVFTIEDEKNKDLIFKEAFKKCDCMELVRIIKTIYEKKLARQAQGKKITAGDERYFKMAEDTLFGELAVALGIEKKEVGTLIEQRIA